MPSVATARPTDAATEPVRGIADDRLLTVTEAADRLRRHPSTLYRWLAAGSFPTRAFRIGARWCIDGTDLDEWLRTR